MGKQFKSMVDTCGPKFWKKWEKRDAARRRTPEDYKFKKMQKPVTYVMNEWCNRFNGHVNDVIIWTQKYMVKCCDPSDRKRCKKSGEGYVKKWKKVMAAFALGARNQKIWRGICQEMEESYGRFRFRCT